MKSENGDIMNAIDTICKVCGRKIVIIKKLNGVDIIDGDRTARKENGDLIIFRHNCKLEQIKINHR